jgi:diguanylate cyclase (GGDEF)-like protein
MKVEGGFVRGRVARRILGLFVLSAFIPALVLAILSLTQVRAVLTEQARGQLFEAAKAYGMKVYERLLLDHDGLRQIALALREGAAPGPERMATLQRSFSALTIAGPQAPAVPILGKPLAWPSLGPEARAHLARDESVLILERTASAEARVLLVQQIDAARPQRFALVAELDPVQLWGPADSFSPGIGLCVLADSGVKPFCSETDPRPDSALAGQWQLFLKPRFVAPDWTVIAIEPRSAALAPVEKFTRIFVGVMVLALLMVALLSVNQIRRTMGPLDQLIKGTRRLAGGDFGHPVVVAGNDDFAELADSFNHMSARLGRQLDTLKVLSSIDRLILSRMDIDPVFGLVLARIRELVPAAFVAIVVPEADGAGEARMHALAGADQGSPELARIRLPRDLLAQAHSRAEGFWIDGFDGLPPKAAPKRTFVLPIPERGSVCAFACLCPDDESRLGDDIRAALHDLCGRVGVALSSAARDEQLIYQVRHDDLTGLPNRLLFSERLSQEIAAARRDARSLALLYVDLDHFKRVNDSLGHTAGDELLGQSAQRMRVCLRESDTLARLGGDEFAIILPNISGPRSATTVAENIVQALSDPFVVGQQEAYINASIGIAVCPTDGTDSETLLKKADTAMYRAKDSGRGLFVYFEERMNAEAVERVTLERELRQALLREEFMLHYQPQFDLRSGRISGVEALVRWNHPHRPVPPGVFIPVAEETGLIEELGRRVLVQACTQHAAWRSAGLRPPRIAVNVSERQFRRGDLVRVVEEALRKSGTPAAALEIEVTESLFMDESANAVAVLNKLRQMGVQVAIDDFGTGYSSMSYLKRLPVDVLKVDQSFIADMTENHDARAITKAIINLAHTLQKSVVAEGVETQEQTVLLRRWRCNRVQGYHFSPPLAADRFAELLHGQKPAAEAQAADAPASLPAD